MNIKIFFHVIDEQDQIITTITSKFNYFPDEDELIEFCDDFVEEYRYAGAVDCEWEVILNEFS